MKTAVVENHIQVDVFILTEYFLTKQLFSTNTKQRRANNLQSDSEFKRTLIKLRFQNQVIFSKYRQQDNPLIF